MTMRQKIIVFLILFGPIFSGWLNSQEEPVKEKVEVVNIEVPVRVFLDGAPVVGLTRNDFQLFEGKKKQIINGFYVRKKKLGVENVAIKSETASEAVPGRYFVLVFRIIEYNQQMKKGVDYIFEHILRENDRLLVMVNDRTLMLNKDVWQVKRHELLNQVLSEEATKARQRLEMYFLSVQKDLDQTKLTTLMDRGDLNFYPPKIIQFLERYLDTLGEFKKKYLTPNLDNFYNFARHLENIKGEKWVLSFFQIELVPHMKISGSIRQEIDQLIEALKMARSEDLVHARIMDKLLERIDRGLNTADDFPVEEVSKMLVKVDTTYHSFIMGVQRDVISEDLEYKKVASNIENSLRGIAKQSGGEVIFSGDIGSALHSIVEREDIYYVLTYEPKNPAKKEKVRIKLANPKYRLFYDDNVRADYIGEYLKKRRAQDPTLQMSQLQLVDGQLQLEIIDFKMTDTAKGLRGDLNVTVRIRNEQNQQLYDQNRSFLAKEDHVSVTIDFSWLKAGKYIFLVEARDLLTEKTAMDILQATVD
jgi:hypothetical protein